MSPGLTQGRYSTKTRVSDGTSSRRFLYDTSDPECIFMSRSLFAIQFVSEKIGIGEFTEKYERFLQRRSGARKPPAKALSRAPRGVAANLNFLAPAEVASEDLFSATFHSKLDPSNIVFAVSPEGIGEAFHLLPLEGVGPPRLGEKANVCGNVKVQSLMHSINLFQSTLAAPIKLKCLA